MENNSQAPFEDIYPAVDLPACNWDIVFTCFEPLVAVTGGIGTYHRLLLDELARKELNVLILTRGLNLAPDFLPSITKIDVDKLVPRVPFNFVGLEHERFSLRCHFAFRALYDAGHRFGLVEFSDYGCDGFYPLRARAAGAYQFRMAAVRLHSPSVMLIEDNGGSHANQDEYHRDIIDREMSVYQDADAILYGGDAMRDRILDLTRRFGISVSEKMVKCPHPYPRHLFEARWQNIGGSDCASRKILIEGIANANRFASQSELESGRFIGLFGRIEDRKGQFQMLWQALNDQRFVDYLKGSDFHFVVAGHNVLDHIGNYRLNDLYSLMHQKGLEGRIHFTGRVPQNILAKYSQAVEGYIFPSVFENYPNALLEVLPTCRPVAISVHGCMPEITDGFSGITLIDPLKLDLETLINFLSGIPPIGQAEDADSEFRKRVRAFEQRQAQMMEFYTCDSPQPNIVNSNIKLSLGVVIPVYEDFRFLADAIKSARGALDDHEPIVVVDDGSSVENAREISRITNAYGASLIVLPENSGPGVARLRGVESLRTDLIQLCDGDDLLDPVGVNRARAMMANDPDLTMAVGVMRCFQDANHCWVPRNGNLWTAVSSNFSHSGAMFRRQALISALSVDHPRLPLNEDWLMNLLIIAQGGKCRMTPEITYYYRRFGGTRSTQNVGLIGSVTRQIHEAVSRELSFENLETTARIRQILGGGFASFVGSATPNGGAFPLRYQYLDAVFFRLTRFAGMEAFLLRLKRKLMQKRR